MQKKGHLKRRLHQSISLLLVLLLLPYQIANAAPAPDAVGSDSIPGVKTIAEWEFDEAAENVGVISATYGIYETASTFRNVGGVFEDVDVSKKAISYQGWDNGNGNKYWLATVSTTGFENITLSSEQNSSGSGPRDFKVQTSVDRKTWEDVPNTNLKMAVSSFDCPGDTCRLVNTPLLNSNDREILYIRWIVSSDSNTRGNDEGIGGSGSSRIRNIKVSGEPIPGKEPVIPTVDLVQQPADGSGNVPPEAPVEIKFNKAITLDPGYAVRFADENHQPVDGVTLEVLNRDTLRINHPPLTYGKSYTVTVPKELIKGADHVPLVREASWSFGVQDSPLAPKSINMTFNGDPKTSIALAWYTDAMTDTVVQVVEASKVMGNIFPENGALTYQGVAEEIETFMSKSDRSTNHKTKFISHKVIADQLQPGTAYKFRTGNGKSGDWSSIGSFTTDAAGHQPFRFIAGSDSQASSKSDFEPWGDTFRKAADYIGDPKFLISAGDLVDNGDLEEQWQWMLGAAQNQLLQVPYVPVLGGHEVMDYDGDETTPNNNFYNHFNLPKQVVADTNEGSVYSFEYGDALYLIFNSQYSGALAENGKDVEWADDQFWDQVAWMKSTVARSDKKWKFVTFHKSPYAAGDNSAQWEDDRVQFYKKYLIPAFDEMGIDMVFEAHDHMYMRSFQMYNDEVIPKEKLTFDGEGNALNPKGTVYLMSNAFGNKFYYKNNQYELDENGEPREIRDEKGNPVPYDDYFAAIDEQPEKKMFTDVSITDRVLSFTAYTAAVADENQPDTVGDGLKAYDKYGIKRTDIKPDPAEAVKVKLNGSKAVLTWSAPSASTEPVRGFRIYEKNDKVKTHWSKYVPAAEGQTEYSYTVDDINPAKKYEFIVKAVGTRINSDPVEVSTIEGPSESEPPSAPSDLKGTAVSPYQINLKWTASAGNIQAAGYNVYRNGSKVGTTKEISYGDTGLTPDTAYSYAVKAYNAEGMESLASNTVQVTTKPSSTGEGVHKAFPQHTSYVAGSIKPNHLTQAQLDATVGRLYNEWKTKYLKQNPYQSDQYYVWYSDGDWFENNEITVSEAHGYGMLITALLAGHDPEAKKYFDGMYRYFRAHPSEINPDLMAWQQADTGTEIIDINGVDSATDGDMDIAYALLLADSQWGSSGEINYLSQAKKVINAIMKSDVNHSEWTLKLADWVSDNDPMFGNATRPSDFMLQHLKDFKNVSGDANWDRVADKTYNIINSLYENYSPKAGLLPDFVYKDNADGKYKPVSQKKWDTPDGYFLESENDGDYNYNSSRIPWRIGTDYLLTGDTRAKGQLGALNRWIRTMADNDPNKILAGYKLDGSAALNDYADISFSAPMMVSAMIDSSNQEWLNKLWDHNAAVSTEDDLYFGNNLRLLSMIVVSGNWWTPTIVDTEAPMEPTIERAEAVSSSAIDLKWTPSTDNLGVTGYKIYRNDVEIKTLKATEYRDSGLSTDTQYKYYIIAVDAAGNTSKISNVRIVSTLKASGDGGSGGSGGGGSSTPTPTPTPAAVKPSEVPATTPAPEPTRSAFSDIGSPFLWAKEAIEALAAKGIVQGTSSTFFEPGAKMKRADFILILVRAFDLKAGFEVSFADADQDAYYYEALGIAKQLGIASGVGGNRFNPGAEISRQDMMVFIVRALQKSGKLADASSISDLGKFADASKVADYAVKAAAVLVREGIVLGDGKLLHPTGAATRAETAVLFYRIINKYY
ncbi:glycosyl hydrolase family 8 [Paenibacillus etheri]|uniref:glycosyl hydrolase family 8 n=1 Tax=Paenibacillus etheri TaxID=1306852 RepID=UPI0009E7AA2E|nr:glycosyl hydrolase family 8 [Paenibacillus etheri]